MLSSIWKFIVLVVVAAVVAVACKKDALPEAHYFGSMSVRLFNLPGTPESVDLRANGKAVGGINTQSATLFNVPAGEPVELGFYAAGTDSLLMDTTLTVAKNETQSLTLAFSSTLGITGALTLPTREVSSDSSYVILYNNLDEVNFSDPIDMEMWLVDGNTLEEKATDIVYKDIFRHQLYPGFMYTLQEFGPDGQPDNQFWVQKFKDRRTGQYVFQPNMGTEWTEIVDVAMGKTTLVVLNSDAAGNVNPSSIVLN